MAPRHIRQSPRRDSVRSLRSTPGSGWRRLIAALVVMITATVIAPAATQASPSVAEELAAAYEEAQAIALELSIIETDLAVIEGEVARFDEEIAEIRVELDAMADDVRQIAVQRYVSAGNGPITLGDDPMTHQRADVLLSAVQRDSNETMARYEAARDRLQASNDALADRLETQVAQRERMAQRLADLDAELTRLTELQAQLDAEQARVEAEQRQAALRAAASTTSTTRPAAVSVPPTTLAPTTTSSTTSSTTTTITAPDDESEDDDAPDDETPTSSGGFICPVKGVSVFVDTFGAPRSGGRRHMGVDMLAKTGTPVVAPVSGVVAHRGNTVGGMSYHLDGDDGNYYYGTHLSAYGASGRVSAGTVIGYVGDTGNAAGTPHLHFEIHPGGRGTAINPYPTVRAACG